ncbi:hypothetical protein EV356DRAFT_507353 [Viridothelium virens]|uniref:Uncharacterized protein n=1 Tax=Viridothelium virens TaxID=1048519 RepID=A0A6A6HJF7_VIRVR|nr:hypothetical protein EV356DRAFT_507353 [Viridothelium virens]
MEALILCTCWLRQRATDMVYGRHKGYILPGLKEDTPTSDNHVTLVVVQERALSTGRPTQMLAYGKRSQGKEWHETVDQDRHLQN